MADDAQLEVVARAATNAGITVGVAESLTSGALASCVGAATDAAQWFAGAVVSYQTRVKEDLLGLAPGVDTCSGACAEQMAEGARRALSADVTVSTTGVGGPEPQGGHAPGTVYVGWATAAGTGHLLLTLDGAPEAIIEDTVTAAVRLLAELCATTDPESPASADDDGVVLTPISVADAGEILTIQRAAFVSEAQIYDDPHTPPLAQTLDELEAEIAGADGWVARIAGRVVGAIRTRESDGVLLIGRITVAPDVQGAGIGRRLLEAAEHSTTATEAELFTGSLSAANLRLYQRCGYTETERVDGDGSAQVFMRKPLGHAKSQPARAGSAATEPPSS